MDSCCITSQFVTDLDSDELLSMLKDPDPFLCDVAHVMESCIRDADLTPDEALNNNMVSVDIVSSSSRAQFLGVGGSGSSKKINNSRKSKKKSLSHRHHKAYVCDWCDRKASFKSGQGLRFHKTLRCPRREAHLGECIITLHSCAMQCLVP